MTTEMSREEIESIKKRVTMWKEGYLRQWGPDLTAVTEFVMEIEEIVHPYLSRLRETGYIGYEELRDFSEHCTKEVEDLERKIMDKIDLCQSLDDPEEFLKKISELKGRDIRIMGTTSEMLDPSSLELVKHRTVVQGKITGPGYDPEGIHLSAAEKYVEVQKGARKTRRRPEKSDKYFVKFEDIESID